MLTHRWDNIVVWKNVQMDELLMAVLLKGDVYSAT